MDWAYSLSFYGGGIFWNLRCKIWGDVMEDDELKEETITRKFYRFTFGTLFLTGLVYSGLNCL